MQSNTCLNSINQAGRRPWERAMSIVHDLQVQRICNSSVCPSAHSSIIDSLTKAPSGICYLSSLSRVQCRSSVSPCRDARSIAKRCPGRREFIDLNCQMLILILHTGSTGRSRRPYEGPAVLRDISRAGQKTPSARSMITCLA